MVLCLLFTAVPSTATTSSVCKNHELNDRQVIAMFFIISKIAEIKMLVSMPVKGRRAYEMQYKNSCANNSSFLEHLLYKCDRILKKKLF